MAGYRRIKTVVADTPREADAPKETVTPCGATTPRSTSAPDETTERDETHVFSGPEGVKVPSGETKLTAGEVTKLTGVTDGMLRHYDKIGLLVPERTGEGVSNNRKLYGADDLGRLQAILTLVEYRFSLSEIKDILDDDDVDLYAILTEKLWALKREEGRLRALILFAHFVDLIDDDLIEGLANGPGVLDALADLAREEAYHEETLQRLNDLREDEALCALRGLDEIIPQLMLLDQAKGFDGIEADIDAFFAWWDTFVEPVERTGYLGFWALFEDHGLIPAYIETISGKGDAGTLQMCAFFVMMVRFMRASGETVARIARAAEHDVVAAIEEARGLVRASALALVGEVGVESLEDETLADLAFHQLVFALKILEDDWLSEYLGVDKGLLCDKEDIEKTLQILDVMGSNE